MNQACQHLAEIQKYLDNTDRSKVTKQGLAAHLKAQKVPAVVAGDVAETVYTKLTKYEKTNKSGKLYELYKKIQEEPTLKTKSKDYKELIKKAELGRVSITDVKRQIEKDLGVPQISKQTEQAITKATNDLKKASMGMDASKKKLAMMKLEQTMKEVTPPSWRQKMEVLTNGNLLIRVPTYLNNIISNELNMKAFHLQNFVMGRAKVGDMKLFDNVRAARKLDSKARQAAGIYGTGEVNARAFRDGGANALEKGFNKYGQFVEKTLHSVLSEPDMIVRSEAQIASGLANIRAYKTHKNFSPKTLDEFSKFMGDLETGKKKLDPKASADKNKLLLADLREQMELDGAKTTFTNPTVIAQMALGINRTILDAAKKSNVPGFLPIVEFGQGSIMKYVNIPSAIATALLDLTPATGLVMAGGRFLGRNRAAGKNIWQSITNPTALAKAELFTHLGRYAAMTVGVGGVGYALSSMGLIVPEGYKGEEVYRINVNGQDMNINLAPLMFLNQSLTFGARVEQARKQGKAFAESLGIGFKSSVGDSMNILFEHPLMRGMTAIGPIGDAMKAFEEGDLDWYEHSNKFLDAVGAFTISGMSQHIPFLGLTRNIAGAGDNYERNIKGDSLVEKSINQIKGGIPGLRQTLDTKITLSGQEMKKFEQDEWFSTGLRLVNEILNPMKLTDADTSATAIELKRLQKAGVRKYDIYGNPPKNFTITVGRGQNKTSTEYAFTKEGKRAYLIEMNQRIDAAFGELIQTDEYINAKSDKERANMATRISDHIKNGYRGEPGLDDWAVENGYAVPSTT